MFSEMNARLLQAASTNDPSLINFLRDLVNRAEERGDHPQEIQLQIDALLEDVPLATRNNLYRVMRIRELEVKQTPSLTFFPEGLVSLIMSYDTKTALFTPTRIRPAGTDVDEPEVSSSSHSLSSSPRK